MAGSASFAKINFIIIDADGFYIIFLLQFFGHYFYHFRRCTIFNRTAINHQCFHFFPFFIHYIALPLLGKAMYVESIAQISNINRKSWTYYQKTHYLSNVLFNNTISVHSLMQLFFQISLSGQNSFYYDIFLYFVIINHQLNFNCHSDTFFLWMKF